MSKVTSPLNPRLAGEPPRAADATPKSGLSREELAPLVLIAALTGLLIWGYWNSLQITAQSWSNPLYSHGYIVPIFALLLLWLRREPVRMATPSGCWAGLALLAVGLGIRMYATRYTIVTLELASFVPSLAGVFLLVGGWSLIRWAGPAIAFLVFMFPLPTFVKRNLLEDLQRLATITSTYVLQTFGIAAYREGNRISIGELQLGVVDACSGLRMSTNLLALVVAILLITRRPWWERGVILLSAIPIALTVNVVRIVSTAVFHVTAGTESVGKAFHDWAGFLMMPLALGLLYLLMLILSHLVTEEEDGSELAAAGIGLRRDAPADEGLPAVGGPVK